MHLSRYFISCAVSALLALTHLTATAQETTTETRCLDQRAHIGYSGWQQIIPTHVKTQYAGGMGLASIGAGWDYGKKCRWETDVMVGFLPKHYSEDFALTFALKQNYIPWSIRCHERFSIEPLTASLYVTLLSGDNYWMSEPDRYGGPYYRFSTRMRINMGFGQRATYHLKNHGGLLRSITFYYEFHACDLDIIAKFTNKELKMEDIAYFSFGLKFHLMRN